MALRKHPLQRGCGHRDFVQCGCAVAHRCGPCGELVRENARIDSSRVKRIKQLVGQCGSLVIAKSQRTGSDLINTHAHNNTTHHTP